MKKTTRLMSFILAALMASATLLASCANTADDKVTSESEADVTEAVTEAETEDPRLSVDDELPEQTFDGYEYRMYSRSADMYYCECYTEAENGEIRNDALIKRNRKIEERFDCKITAIASDVSEEDISGVTNSIIANDDAYDIALPMAFITGPAAIQGYFLDWNDLEYIDLSKPWYIDSVNSKLQVGDTIFTVVGDTCISTLELAYAIFYNKTLAEKYNIPDLYEEVNNNTWTMDRMFELCQGMYSDLNGNGSIDNGDIFGYDGDAYTAVDCYPLAWNINILEQQDGSLVCNLNSEKMQAALDKLNSFMWGDSAITNNLDTFWTYNTLFTTTILGSMYGAYREFDNEYGVLPYPKFDETQEKYMSGCMDRYSVLVMPITVSDIERTSIITEAINAESYKILYPAWYEDSAQNKFARDEGTIEMLDIIMDGRNFDMATLFTNNLNGITWVVRNLCLSNSDALSKQWDSMSKMVTKQMTKIEEAYATYSAQ